MLRGCSQFLCPIFSRLHQSVNNLFLVQQFATAPCFLDAEFPKLLLICPQACWPVFLCNKKSRRRKQPWKRYRLHRYMWQRRNRLHSMSAVEECWGCETGGCTLPETGGFTFNVAADAKTGGFTLNVAEDACRQQFQSSFEGFLKAFCFCCSWYFRKLWIKSSHFLWTNRDRILFVMVRIDFSRDVCALLRWLLLQFQVQLEIAWLHCCNSLAKI